MILHEASQRRFVNTTDGLESVAEYRLDGDRMIFTHTYVPPQLRGQGVAARLIAAGMKYARAEGKKVVPQCSYVEIYLRRHPEDADLRA